MRSSVERRSDILALLQQKGSCRVEALAQHFNVSSVTIRNDLNSLEQQGYITRSHGFAVLNNRLIAELSIADKRTHYPEVKQRIGKRAAALLNANESVIFDSGTTTKAIVSYLGDLPLTVLTNGLDIAMALVACPNVEIRMTGGVLRKNAMSFSGIMADNNLRHYRFDKVFLGVDGFDLHKGITTFNEQEAHLNRLMCEAAEQVIVVADASKFGQYSRFIICQADQIDVLISDDRLPMHYRTQLENAGVTVLLA
ncbi:transcriptional regulator [[Actinobacillus] muris]|uniref:Transcriptional regulator n=1 Tax=Muribacter muris TaxID=67855 RepID=A0A0J5P7U0_9PAST|nr:transcriptional repressor AgaR [Muribacter muris]KMK51830.1 transcriptional regulator [[Actinobacillus] muris] [Muribacter muris]MBF0785842.1 DeoR/GlpR transcriptional regulator [Muribacter muris]MBF0827099.1 DeoR/GlpR transcriptional regulator [Muribacter muris]TFV08541.1 DeoR/GlpR transcriptional regulator [Muribacter muris]